MRARSWVDALVIPILASACGGGAGAPQSASLAAIATYEQAAATVQSSAADYGASMMAATGIAACQRLEDDYDGRVRPLVSQMMGMSGGLDDLIDQHGGASAADLACVSTSMMSELDRHRSAACASPDLTSDQQEAQRHVNLMIGFGGHVSNRCNEMNAALAEPSPAWGPMMDGCELGHDAGMMGAGGMRGAAGMMGVVRQIH